MAFGSKIGVVVIHGVADAEQGANLSTLVDVVRLLQLAAIVIRGPIAGINVALLVTAAYLYGQAIREIANVNAAHTAISWEMLVGIGVSLTCGSLYIIAKKRRAADVASLEVSAWVAVASAATASLLA